MTETVITDEELARLCERDPREVGPLMVALAKELSKRRIWADLQRNAKGFDAAIQNLKAGHRVARAGWNGKGMWICLGSDQENLPAEKFWNPHTRAFAEQNGGHADVLPYIIMKTADGKILMGWLASQTDMLAEDWEIVP